jgi:SulP family sulfate permease
MRTVINIRSGGVTRLSGMIHSVVLAAVVLGVGSVASAIPHAALAGVLVKVGMDIIDFSYLKRAHRGPRWDLVLMALVLSLTVFVDLITAVATGVVLAALAYVKQVAKIQLEELASRPNAQTSPQEQVLLDRLGKQVTIFEFGGPLSFGAAADVGHHVRERYRDVTHSIILDFGRLPYLDVSAARAVETIASDAQKAGKRVYIAGMAKPVQDTLTSLGADASIPDDAHFPTRIEALQAIVDRVQPESRTRPTHLTPIAAAP